MYMQNNNLKPFVLGLIAGALLMVGAVGGKVANKLWNKVETKVGGGVETVTKKEVVDEESVVTKVVEEATPGVVTVSISKTKQVLGDSFDDMFGGLFGFGTQLPKPQQQAEKVEQDIGTGFIISTDGLIVTNKHVVADTNASYKVVIGKDEMLDVKEIYRDPTNDLAILKVDKKDLKPLRLGDSDKIKVGQTAIAIGTALGEFRSTVTKGVISGLGRGITAGGSLEGSEKLDNVIQTDTAINPGNSGGPLFNSAGEVIGVNVAVSAAGQGIGFALPINKVKDVINNFKSTGEFDRPYMGVAYQSISKQAALLNEVPQGVYVRDVIKDSPADKSGIKVGDIITEIDGKKLDDKNNSVVDIINKKKIGDNVQVKLWRDNKSMEIGVKLEKKK